MIAIGSLCTGYGGLDMAAEQLTGGRTVWVADLMPAAATLLAHRYPDAPNLGDITTTDWSTVQPVDVLTAGWPCQPWSVAGKRKGTADARAIWPAVARAVRDLRPGLVLLENVAGIVSAGELARAVGSLADLGYDAQWTCLRAADVGAPHGRNRCFIAAEDAHSGDPDPWDGRPRRSAADADSTGLEGPESETGRELLARCPAPHPDRGRFEELPELDSGQEAGLEASLRDDAVGPVWGIHAAAIARWELTLKRPAPEPTGIGSRGGRQLSARFVEWLQGLPDGWVCDVPGLTLNQQLTLLGNGVVPQQALAAYRELLSPAMEVTE